MATRLMELLIIETDPEKIRAYLMQPENRITIRDLKKIALEAALIRFYGSSEEVMQHLGIGRTTFYRNVRKHGLQRYVNLRKP